MQFFRSGVLPAFYDRLKGFDHQLYSLLLEQTEFFLIDRLRDWILNKRYVEAVKIDRSVKPCESTRWADVDSGEADRGLLKFDNREDTADTKEEHFIYSTKTEIPGLPRWPMLPPGWTRGIILHRDMQQNSTRWAWLFGASCGKVSRGLHQDSLWSSNLQRKSPRIWCPKSSLRLLKDAIYWYHRQAHNVWILDHEVFWLRHYLLLGTVMFCQKAYNDVSQRSCSHSRELALRALRWRDARQQNLMGNIPPYRGSISIERLLCLTMPQKMQQTATCSTTMCGGYSLRCRKPLRKVEAGNTWN